LEKLQNETIAELRASVEKQQAKEVSAKWNTLHFDVLKNL
jgi:hypothetical protein